MGSLRQWLQDWSDACDYANECAPDLSFLSPGEPYTALLAIGLSCLGAWWWNERPIPSSQRMNDKNLATPPETTEAASSAADRKLEELRQIIEQSRAGNSRNEKEAA